MRRCLSVTVILAAALLQLRAAANTPGEFPFAFREGLLWVEVTTSESSQPLNFLLDTGAEVSVINLNTANRLGLALGPRVSVHGVKTTTTGYWPTRLGVSAGSATLPSEFLVLDLSRLSHSCEQPVDGLIGADFFRQKVVQIDFVTCKVRAAPSFACPAEMKSLPLEIRPGGLRVNACVNGIPGRFRIDTGCATALQWVTGKAPLEGCSNTVAVGLTTVDIPQTQTTLELGGQTFTNVPTGIHRKPIFPGEAGLLGDGLLSRFDSLTIDARSGRLILGRLRNP